MAAGGGHWIKSPYTFSSKPNQGVFMPGEVGTTESGTEVTLGSQLVAKAQDVSTHYLDPYGKENYWDIYQKGEKIYTTSGKGNAIAFMAVLKASGNRISGADRTPQIKKQMAGQIKSSADIAVHNTKANSGLNSNKIYKAVIEDILFGSTSPAGKSIGTFTAPKKKEAKGGGLFED